jgi:hypothetical protein
MDVTEETRHAFGKWQPVEATDADTHEGCDLVQQERDVAMPRRSEVEDIDPSFYEVEELELHETA